MVVTAARLLDGDQVPLSTRSWTASLTPERVTALLDTLKTDGQLLVVRPEAVLIAGDVEIPYGALAQWAPAVRLINRRELEAHNGTDDINAHFEVIDDRSVCWLPRQRAEELAEVESPPA